MTAGLLRHYRSSGDVIKEVIVTSLIRGDVIIEVVGDVIKEVIVTSIIKG